MSVTKYLSTDHRVTEHFPFHVARYHHNSSDVPPAHFHEFIELVYVVEGNANHMFEGKSYPIKTNDVFIINPGEVHTFELEPGEELEIINCLFVSTFIKDSLLKELGVSQSMDFFYIHPFLDEVERFHHFINVDGNYASRLLSIFEGMIDEYKKGESCFVTLIRLQLIELLLILSRVYQDMFLNLNEVVSSRNENQRLVQRISGYLSRNYDQKITISGLCKLFSISPRHLSRLFKKETNQTVIDMLHAIRIDKAKTLLLDTDYKVIEVALTIGYDDPSYFSKLFQRSVGCSPGKYKTMARQRFSQNNKAYQ
ncbi:MAG TPA: AraC family transcriptional regulator [Candidatus Dormibacteraeota bacterium]|nr:AraC family transcriptional regulator [Candidatus Dormibacteraeota bacterium]